MLPSELRERLQWFVTHPVTAVTTVLGLLAHAFSVPWIDAVWLTLWHNAGMLFTALSVFQTQFADGPLFGVIPLQWIVVATYVVGGVFVLSLVTRFADKLQERLNDEQA